MSVISHHTVSRYQEAKLNLQSLFKQTYQVAFGLAMVLLITAGRPSSFGLTITVVLGIAFVSWSETKRLSDNRIESNKELLRNIRTDQEELLEQEGTLAFLAILPILHKYELKSHTKASNLNSLIVEEKLKIAARAKFAFDQKENFSQELDEIFEQFTNRYQRIEYETNPRFQKILSEKLEKDMNDFIQLLNSLKDRFEHLIGEELLLSEELLLKELLLKEELLLIESVKLIEAVKLKLNRANVH